jgi:hypothetical protein
MMAVGILEIDIAERGGVPLILAPSPQGMLEVAVLEHPVSRVAYGCLTIARAADIRPDGESYPVV